MDGLLRVHTDTRFCHNHPFRLDESQCICYDYIHHNRKVVEIYTADIRGISRELAVTPFSWIIIRKYLFKINCTYNLFFPLKKFMVNSWKFMLKKNQLTCFLFDMNFHKYSMNFHKLLYKPFLFFYLTI